LREEFCASQVTLSHTLLLADREAMDMLTNSIRKVEENADELLD